MSSTHYFQSVSWYLLYASQNKSERARYSSRWVLVIRNIYQPVQSSRLMYRPYHEIDVIEYMLYIEDHLETNNTL